MTIVIDCNIKQRTAVTEQKKQTLKPCYIEGSFFYIYKILKLSLIIMTPSWKLRENLSVIMSNF